MTFNPCFITINKTIDNYYHSNKGSLLTLNQLLKGEQATIKNIQCDKILKSRFNSLGIKKGEKLQVLEITLARETIEIKINRTKLALRVTEASKIDVEKC